MNSNYSSNMTTRKAISTIVGTIFFLILLVGTMSAFVAAFNLTSDLFQEQIEISDRAVAKAQEEFTRSATVDFTDSLKLDVWVENKGPVSIEFTELWIIDKLKKEVQKLDIELADAHVPIATKKNLLENQRIELELGGEYNVKAVTARGNAPVMNLTVTPRPPTPLVVTLTSIPSEIANNSNFTLVMTVFNNSTEPFFNIGAPGAPVVLPEDAVISVEQTSATNFAQLNPGQSVFFTWDYYIQAAVGKKISFYINSTALKDPTTGSSGGGDTIQSNQQVEVIQVTHENPNQFLTARLVQRPEIFMVFPSPVGEGFNDDDPGYWGAIIVNPTNQTLIVNRVVIMLATAVGGTNLVIDADQYNQHIHPVDNSTGTPSPIGQWCIPEDNMMAWSATTGSCSSPTFAASELIRIPAVDAREFVLKVVSEAAADNDAMMVAGNTYTSSGQFTKITHSASSRDDRAAVTVVNVYPTPKDVTANDGSGDSDGDPASLNDDDNLFEGVKDAGINDACTFYITVREAQTSTSEYVPGTSGTGNAHLIINLPTGFPNLTIPAGQTGFGTAVARVYSDGAKQIAVPISDDLGETSGVERLTFKFTVTTPELDAEKMYIFYAFVNGTDVDTNPLGPVSEAVVLRVDPTNGSDHCEG